MIRSLPVLAAALMISAAAPTQAAQTRAFTARDLVRLERVGDPQVSPDGRMVAFSQRSTDLEANKGVSAIWLVAADASAPAVKLAASAGGASHPRWSADGKAIYFMSSRSGSAQVWRTDATGAAATQVTRLPLDVAEFRLAPDGRTLVVAMAVFPDCPTLACTRDRAAAKAASKAHGVVYDRLFVRHWDNWADGTRNHLFAVRLDAPEQATDLMPGFDGDSPTQPFGDDDDFAISPDGREVTFAARVAGKTEPWSTNFDLWSVPLDGSKRPQNLTPDNPAEDVGPTYSPDGSKLAWRAMKRPGFEADRFGVMVRDLKTGQTREIDPAFDRSADHLAWASDGRALYLTAADLGTQRLYRIDPTTGAATPLTTGGHVSAFSATGRTVVVARDSLSGPADLFRLQPKGEPVRLTAANAATLDGLAMGGFEQFSFPGWNGETVRGFVVKPAGWQPGHKYPTAFIIHGGPQSSFGDGWSYRWNPQTYAGRGYAVVFIDFHGSTGYGQAFTDAISGHWGDRPLEDLQKGWAAAQAKYDWIDGDRACALGASYGGFMVYWIAGNWSKPWKCLVDHDGVFDTRFMGFSTEELWFSEWENGHVTPFADPTGYERFNPANHVAAWEKPTLVIHSARDYRVPLDQGVAAFTGLQRKGVESRFLYFPDENHWVLKPQNSVQWHDTVEGWLKTWIGDAPR